MKKAMDWKARVGNKTFWLTLIPAVLLLVQAVMAIFGYTFDFGVLQGRLLDVINTLFAVLVILGVVADPKTPGITDKVEEEENKEDK